MKPIFVRIDGQEREVFDAAEVRAALQRDSAAPEGLRALDAEIARRQAPDYKWASTTQPYPTRFGIGNAMQRGELTGLLIARQLLSEHPSGVWVGDEDITAVVEADAGWQRAIAARPFPVPAPMDAATSASEEAGKPTSGLDHPSRRPWRYAHAAGIEGLHWDIYAGEGIDGWLVASVGMEADAALIVNAVNAAPEGEPT